MDVTRMLQELRSEREAVEQAIMTIERLALGRGRRRGRPPAWMSAVQTGQAAAPARRRARPPGSKHKKVEEKSSE